MSGTRPGRPGHGRAGPNPGALLLPARPGLRKRFHRFTTAEGAEFHDAPMAPQTRNQAVLDWLDTIIG